jgi:uncharacterized membrane protein YphA (DoxX/SURF4 family)
MDQVVMAAPPAAPARAAPPSHRGGGADAGLLYWMLRVACAAEFIGHGAFGIMTKAAWVPYFGVVGIPPELAWKLMPVIGTVDVTIGLLVGIVRPVRVVLLYMAVWGFLTATIRPLAGESIWEFIERIPNWAIPLAFLCLRGLGRSRHDWLS